MEDNILFRKKYLLFLTMIFLLTASNVFSDTVYGQEFELKEGDKIIIELFNSHKLNGKYVRMDSLSITYIPSGRTPFYKPKENTVKFEKIKQIYGKKGWVIYITPKNLRNYDYPTHEAFLGFSAMFIRKIKYRNYTHREEITELVRGVCISGGGTIKKWMSLEARLNVFKEEGSFSQLFLSFNGYQKKHRYFAGFGVGAMGYWFLPTTPVYNIGAGVKLYMFKDLTLRIGLYDYFVPSRRRNKHNIITEIGLTVSEW